jgi:hypothetical protein
LPWRQIGLPWCQIGLPGIRGRLAWAANWFAEVSYRSAFKAMGGLVVENGGHDEETGRWDLLQNVEFDAPVLVMASVGIFGAQRFGFAMTNRFDLHVRQAMVVDVFGHRHRSAFR